MYFGGTQKKPLRIQSMGNMGQKTAPYILVSIFVGLAYLGDVATFDEAGSFSISQDVFATETDSSESKSVLGCPDSLGPSTTSFLPLPPLALDVALLLEGEEPTKWLGDLPLIPRPPPRAG